MTAAKKVSSSVATPKSTKVVQHNRRSTDVQPLEVTQGPSVDDLSLTDLLGAPLPTPTAKKRAAALTGPKTPRVVLTAEEKKAKRNEAQRILRSTPEGKAYANAASKKSIAAKKARIEAELAALRAIAATLAPDAATLEVAVEAVLQEADVIDEEVKEAAPVILAKVTKANKKSSKKAVLAEMEEAPY